MESIPQEIFLSILDCLGAHNRDLLPYVTISRRWQYAIERRTFRHFRRLIDADLPGFANLFRDGQAHRKALVKAIEFNVRSLPEYNGNDCHCHEEINNQLYTAAVFELFRILESFNDDEGVQNSDGLELTFSSISSPSDKFLTQGNGPDICSKFVQVLEPGKLPSLSCVSGFRSGRISFTRCPDPASMMLVANKLPRLQHLDLGFNNDEDHVGSETQKRMRHDFANALSIYTNYTNSLELFKIHFCATHPSDEANTPLNFVVPSSSPIDPLNLALHKFIQHANISIASFSATHVISPEFFWPPDTPIPTAASPFWPNLKEIITCISPATPDGDWYFIPDLNIASYSEFAGPAIKTSNSEPSRDAANDGDDDHIFNEFRTIPDSRKINPLLMAMARAVRYAPSLQMIDMGVASASLEPKYVDLDEKGVDEFKRQFDIYYLARGVDDRFEETLPDKPRLVCDVGTWRLEEEVERLWREALGPDGVIIYR